MMLMLGCKWLKKRKILVTVSWFTRHCSFQSLYFYVIQRAFEVKFYHSKISLAVLKNDPRFFSFSFFLITWGDSRTQVGCEKTFVAAGWKMVGFRWAAKCLICSDVTGSRMQVCASPWLLRTRLLVCLPHEASGMTARIYLNVCPWHSCPR